MTTPSRPATARGGAAALRGLTRVSGVVNWALAAVAGVALIATMLILVANIVMRTVAAPMNGTFELISMAAVVVFGLAPGEAHTLPALAWLLRFTTRPEDLRLAVVRTACVGYAAFAGIVVAESLAGMNPMAVAAVPVAVTGLLVVGTIMLMGAGVVAIQAVATSGGIRAEHEDTRTWHRNRARCTGGVAATVSLSHSGHRRYARPEPVRSA